MSHVLLRGLRASLTATLLLGVACITANGQTPQPAASRSAAAPGRITKPPPATSTRPEDWTITWERFLKRWEEGNGSTAANLFALDQPPPGIPGGKVKMADALTMRGTHPERSLRLIRHLGSGQTPPLKMIITAYWTVKPGTPGALLVVTEETFDINVINQKLYVLDYHLVDKTAAEQAVREQTIKEYEKKFTDAKFPPDRLSAALVIAIAQMELARVDDYWKTIKEKMPLKDMKPYPETQKQLRDALTRLAKDDTIPQAYAEIAGEIGFAAVQSRPATLSK